MVKGGVDSEGPLPPFTILGSGGGQIEAYSANKIRCYASICPLEAGFPPGRGAARLDQGSQWVNPQYAAKI